MEVRQRPMLARAYEVMFLWWREQKQKRNELWIADSSHQCNRDKERCTITNMYARIYEVPRSPDTGSSGRTEWHICLEGCSRKGSIHSAAQLRANINNVFICERTGKFHVCDSHCEESTLRTRSAEHVCRMSGLTRGSEFHDTYTAPEDKGSAALSAHRKRKLVDLAPDSASAATTPGDLAHREYERWLHSLGLDMKSKNIATQLVNLLLFNEKRQKLENERLKKMRAQAKAVVLTYKRRCEKAADKPVCVMYAQQLYENCMQSSRPPPYLETSKPVADRIVDYYAHFCMLMYSKLQKYVFHEEEEQEEEEDIPSLKECVPAILYIMREGLNTSGGSPLITKDMFLDCLLPGENNLDRFDIKKTQFTRVRNRIAAGTAYSIEDKHLCPAQLSVIPLSMEDIVDVKANPISQLFMAANPVI